MPHISVQFAATVHGLLTKRKHFTALAIAALAFPAAALPADGKPRSGPGAGLGQAHPALAPLQAPVARFHAVIDDVADRIRSEARAARRAALAEQRRERRQALETLPGGVSVESLEAIAACESGGDPTIVSADGSYRGKYQFSVSTWESVGGSGDPAAAPAYEQDYRAALLYSRAGSSPWPVCG